MTPNIAYEAYRSGGVTSGTPLNQPQFAEFWANLSADDREYWIARFRAGATPLTREFVENVDVAVVSPQMARAVGR